MKPVLFVLLFQSLKGKQATAAVTNSEKTRSTPESFNSSKANRPRPRNPAWATAQTAVNSFNPSKANRLRPRKVTVSNVSP